MFTVRKLYIEQMFVSVRMQFDNHIDCRHTTSSAGLTIVANVAIATGSALLEAPRTSVINLIYYIIYQNLFNLRSQYFAKFARSSK